MALSARELALRLARHIGVGTLDPDDPANEPPLGLQPGDVGYLVACINGALQELWSAVPTPFRYAQAASGLHAPTPVTLTVTHGSTAITGLSPYAAWMEGCTIRIGVQDNELLAQDQLLAPYNGPTDPGGSTVEGTVYADCVTPATRVSGLVDPIRSTRHDDPLERPLQRLLHRQGFDEVRRRHGRAPGVPTVCFLETRFSPAQAGPAIRVRLHPMPNEAGTLLYGTRQEVPVTISEGALGVQTDPGVMFQLPDGWDEAVLLPLALIRFSAHPAFKPTNQRAELVRQADLARLLMLRARPDRATGAMTPTFR